MVYSVSVNPGLPGRPTIYQARLADGFEAHLVAILVVELDFKTAVVLEFGGTVAADLGHVVGAVLAEEHCGWGILEFEGGCVRPDGDLAAAARVEGDHDGADEVEVVAALK